MNPVTIEKNQDRIYSNRELGGYSWHVKKNPSAIAHEKKHAAVHTYAGRGLGENGERLSSRVATQTKSSPQVWKEK